tara:strand:- start:4395 stop:5330 length:936 start_codon:yes stop_codon:yes gene_type:complete
MSEEPTADAADSAGQEADPITWENSPIAQIYNPDGTQKADAPTAMAALGKEDIAGHTLRNGQGLWTALKTGKDATAFASQKQEERDGFIKLPGEDATDDDRSKFSESIGALSSKEDYLAQIWPDDLPEGFAKDESLADIFAGHVALNPVNSAESTKQLVAKVIGYQGEQIEAHEKTEAEEAEKQELDTRDKLIVACGGTEHYNKFAKEAKADVISKEVLDMGFTFQRGEGDDVVATDPLDARLLTHLPFLLFLKERADSRRSAGIPRADPGGSSQGTNDEKARAIYEEAGVGGWKSTDKMKEYYRLKGISS